MKKVIRKAEGKFERADFNILYDYLWRDKLMAEHTARNGKNKEIRARASEKENTINHIINLMEIIEKDGLTFANGEIHKEEKLKVCAHCLMGIEAHEGKQRTTEIFVDETDETESRCEWCEESGNDTLYVLE